MMKKWIPVLTAIVLIILIGGFTLAGHVIKKYSYSSERADLNEYFALTNEEEVAIVLQNELREEKALLQDGKYYFSLNSIHAFLNTRFYWDTTENLLLYTTPTQVISSRIGETTYYVDGVENDATYLISFVKAAEGEDEKDVLYVAADFVKLYTNFSYETFTEPNRMQVYTEWPTRQVAYAKKDSAVRYRGGVKSPILKDVVSGEKLIVLDQIEEWSEVKTCDGFIGYIKNNHLKNREEEMPTPVTDYQVPEYTSCVRDHKISLGWHVVGGTGGNDTLTEVVAPTQGMNVISPTWFKLCDNEGNFTSFATQDYVTSAHSMGLEVWALVDNFSYEIDTYSVLNSTTKRNHLVQGLIDEALRYNLDGINVDFEGLGEESGPHFTQFLRELSIQCRLNQIVLSVDNYVPFQFNDFYNRQEQGVVADYVIIMGYDEHWHGSKDPGSVASIEYVRNGIEKMIEEVPEKKVINGLPFYSILWKTSGDAVNDDYVTMIYQKSMLDNLGMPIEWNDETCQNYGELEKGGTLYQIWLEDIESIQVKLNVMSNYDLGGVAVWRLGYEDPVVWSVIKTYSQQ